MPMAWTVVAGGRRWRVQRELRVRESGSFVTRRRHDDVTSLLEGGKLFCPTSCLFFPFQEKDLIERE